MNHSDEQKSFTLYVGENRLVIKPVKDELGVSHYLIINGELRRCDFREAEGILRP